MKAQKENPQSIVRRYEIDFEKSNEQKDSDYLKICCRLL